MFIENELVKRNIPKPINQEQEKDKIITENDWKKYREDIIEILSRNEYGHIPPSVPVTYEITSHNKNDYAGKVEYTSVNLRINIPNSIFLLPLHVFIPNRPRQANPDKKLPLLLHIAFREEIPDRYMPVEEITDRGYILASFCYNNVTSDANDGFRSGIASMYDRRSNDWGKISMWAFAASRALDYLLTLNDVDSEAAAVIGHSRLGKTSLWCGANDERFKFVISNDSGCSGGAITRSKTGEHISDITKNFSYWFCENYKNYADNEENMPFDQHFLLAACAPRYVIIGTAQEDNWADPNSEFLSAYAASKIYEKLGYNGLISEDRYPLPGDIYHGGNIGFHMRTGGHFLSREDWNYYMDFIDKKLQRSGRF